MRVNVVAVPKSSRNAIEKLAEGSYKIWVTALPIRGRANEAVGEILAKEFEVPKSMVKLVSGHRTKKKVFEIS
ncbi:MAG: DUF167 domain-containing protein [Patescibacteria group bacterium]|nr:DUF167 domain-containing protein [Patescibacteria group bacterium]